MAYDEFYHQSDNRFKAYLVCVFTGVILLYLKTRADRDQRIGQYHGDDTSTST